MTLEWRGTGKRQINSSEASEALALSPPLYVLLAKRR